MALNIHQKINAVMKEIEYLSKDDHIKFQNTNYKAISEEKVTSAVRVSMAKNGLTLIPIEQTHEREGNLSIVNVKYKLTNIDNPQEFEIIASTGTGVDTQDKGVGKAMTYAFKYALLRSFMIPTGEDPDKISSEELDAKLGKEQAKEEVKKLSEAQVKRLFAIASSKGYTPEDVKKAIISKFKKIDVAALTKEEYDTVCNGYENAKPKK